MATGSLPDRAIEKLEVLDGSRNGSRDNAAVRISDLSELLRLTQIKTASVSAAPTSADFNSLLTDLKSISTALIAVATAVQKRRDR